MNSIIVKETRNYTNVRLKSALIHRKCWLSSLDIQDERRSVKSTLKKNLDGPLPIAYVPSDVESEWYAWWVSQGFFDSGTRSRNRNTNKYLKNVNIERESIDKNRRFTMVLPPPNVTGDLHVGHALAVTVEDVIQRWQRSNGALCHWVPGFDHAGIATQIVVEKKLQCAAANNSMGLDVRHRMGRQEFVREVLDWSNAKRRTIRSQLNLLGASLDWKSEMFTMDPKFSRAVTEAFVRLHEAGLIRRRRTLVNWCCHLRSTISDIEVDHIVVGANGKAKSYKDPSYDRPIFGRIYRFAYKLVNENGRDEEIEVATTRPETMLGDVAIAVNQNDSRYVRFIGRLVVHPFDHGRLLPIIQDSSVDPNFGTGAVKITPGHSHEDFLLAERYAETVAKHDDTRPLPLLSILDEKGHVAKPDLPQFHDLNRFSVRRAIIQELAKLGLFRSEEDHEVTLPVCSRSGSIVEPMLKSQWFLDISQMMAELANDLKAENLDIIPDHARKDVKHWLSINTKDSKWCLSRQLWWGHQIPAYRLAKNSADDDSSWIVARSVEEAKERCHSIEVIRDNDVLDTWFSSSLFPFVVHGWPDNSAALRAHYPLDLMETGRDILFFWVIRMLMLGKALTGRLPFRKILAHGLVCDAHGRKMSKSLGNVLDPTHIIDGVSLEQLRERIHSYRRDGYIDAQELRKALDGLTKNFPQGIPQCGADSLRFALCSQNIKDQTVSLDVKFINSCRLFCNKIWQASRFYLISMNNQTKISASKSSTTVDDIHSNMSSLDRWILSQLAKMVVELDQHLNAYDFHLATWTLKKFWYFTFCDFYLEGVKPILSVENAASDSSAEACRCVLRTCIRTGLVAIAPFMPFLAEELYQRLKFGEEHTDEPSVCQAPYPSPDEWKRWCNPQLDEAFQIAADVVSDVRSFRHLFDLPAASVFQPRVHLKIKSDFNEFQVLEGFNWSDTKTLIDTMGRCFVNFRDRDLAGDSYDADFGMILKSSPKYQLSVELVDSNQRLLVDVEKSIANLERRLDKLLKERDTKRMQKHKHKHSKEDQDDDAANILDEKTEKIENHLAYLRTFKTKRI